MRRFTRLKKSPQASPLQEILHTDLRSGGPDLHRHHRAHQGNHHIRYFQRRPAGYLCGPLCRKCYPIMDTRKTDRSKTRSGMGHFRSSFCVVAICTALSRMMDFWKTGQFSAFSCCVAKSVWRSHTCRDNSSSPALVWGYRTVRLNDLPFEIGITSRGIYCVVTKRREMSNNGSTY